MRALLTLLVLLTQGVCTAYAGENFLPKWDLVTSIGIGAKGVLPASSYLFHPDCKKAIVVEPAYPDNPRGITDPYSCGGDNPAYVGYPIALERTFRNGALRLRAGFFHQSQWFDGNGEIQATWPAADLTINWSQMRRNRRKAR